MHNAGTRLWTEGPTLLVLCSSNHSSTVEASTLTVRVTR